MAKKNIQITYVVTDAALLKSAKVLQQNEKAAKDADAAINKFGKDAQKAGNDAGGSFLKLGDIWKGLIAIGMVNFVTNLGKKILDLGVKQEQLNIAFTTFLGSAEKARKLLGDLTKFAIVTPFTPDQVNSAAKALLAFGVAGEDIIPTLKMLGDVSSGTGKDLTEMAIIFGQIRSTGRLMGQDLLQLINAGFNPLQVISQKTGKSVADLKKEMEKGLITFDMVSDAFKTATSEGGLFFNLMEKQSQSVGGLLSTVSGNIDEILKNIFAANSGPIKEFTQQLVELSEALLAASKSSEQLAQEAALFENKLLTDNFIAFAKAFKDLQSAQSANNKSLDQELARLTEEQKQYETATRELTDADIKAYDAILNRISQIKRERVAVEEYVTTQKKKDQAQKDNGLTLEKLKEQSKLLEDQIQKSSLTDLAEIQVLKRKKEAIDDIIKALNAQATAEVKVKGGITGSIPKPIVDIAAGISGLIKQGDSQRELEDANKEREAEIERNANNEVYIEDQKQQRIRQLRQAGFDYGISLLGDILSASIQSNDSETESIKESYDNRIALAGDNKDAITQIRQEQAAFEKQAAAKQAQEDKERQIKQMIITNLQNSLRALGTPPVPNFALAGLTAAYGLGTVVAAQAIGFKDGVIGIEGPGTGTSDSIPARLSRGESVITADATGRSRNLLEAINSGAIDDRILRKIKADHSVNVNSFDDSRMVEAVNKLVSKSSYEEGYFTVNRVIKSKNLTTHIKSKFRS